MSVATQPRVTALVVTDAPESVSGSRRWVRRFLERAGVHDACIEDAVLVVSELVSNAIRHGQGDVICHAVLLDPARCCLTVIDGGVGQPQIVKREPDTVGGLGLVIVERLALEWGIAEFQGGKAVFAVIAADGLTPDRLTPDADDG